MVDGKISTALGLAQIEALTNPAVVADVFRDAARRSEFGASVAEGTFNASRDTAVAISTVLGTPVTGFVVGSLFEEGGRIISDVTNDLQSGAADNPLGMSLSEAATLSVRGDLTAGERENFILDYTGDLINAGAVAFGIGLTRYALPQTGLVPGTFRANLTSNLLNSGGQAPLRILGSTNTGVANGQTPEQAFQDAVIDNAITLALAPITTGLETRFGVNDDLTNVFNIVRSTGVETVGEVTEEAVGQLVNDGQLDFSRLAVTAISTALGGGGLQEIATAPGSITSTPTTSGDRFTGLRLLGQQNWDMTTAALADLEFPSTITIGENQYNRTGVLPIAEPLGSIDTNLSIQRVQPTQINFAPIYVQDGASVSPDSLFSVSDGVAYFTNSVTLRSDGALIVSNTSTPTAIASETASMTKPNLAEVGTTALGSTITAPTFQFEAVTLEDTGTGTTAQLPVFVPLGGSIPTGGFTTLPNTNIDPITAGNLPNYTPPQIDTGLGRNTPTPIFVPDLTNTGNPDFPSLPDFGNVTNLINSIPKITLTPGDIGGINTDQIFKPDISPIQLPEAGTLPNTGSFVGPLPDLGNTTVDTPVTQVPTVIPPLTPDSQLPTLVPAGEVSFNVVPGTDAAAADSFLLSLTGMSLSAINQQLKLTDGEFDPVDAILAGINRNTSISPPQTPIVLQNTVDDNKLTITIGTDGNVTFEMDTGLVVDSKQELIGVERFDANLPYQQRYERARDRSLLLYVNAPLVNVNAPVGDLELKAFYTVPLGPRDVTVTDLRRTQNEFILLNDIRVSRAKLLQQGEYLSSIDTLRVLASQTNRALSTRGVLNVFMPLNLYDLAIPRFENEQRIYVPNTYEAIEIEKGLNITKQGQISLNVEQQQDGTYRLREGSVLTLNIRDINDARVPFLQQVMLAALGTGFGATLGSALGGPVGGVIGGSVGATTVPLAVQFLTSFLKNTDYNGAIAANGWNITLTPSDVIPASIVESLNTAFNQPNVFANVSAPISRIGTTVHKYAQDRPVLFARFQSTSEGGAAIPENLGGFRIPPLRDDGTPAAAGENGTTSLRDFWNVDLTNYSDVQINEFVAKLNQFYGPTGGATYFDGDFDPQPGSPPVLQPRAPDNIANINRFAFLTTLYLNIAGGPVERYFQLKRNEWLGVPDSANGQMLERPEFVDPDVINAQQALIDFEISSIINNLNSSVDLGPLPTTPIVDAGLASQINAQRRTDWEAVLSAEFRARVPNWENDITSVTGGVLPPVAGTYGQAIKSALQSQSLYNLNRIYVVLTPAEVARLSPEIVALNPSGTPDRPFYELDLSPQRFYDFLNDNVIATSRAEVIARSGLDPWVYISSREEGYKVNFRTPQLIQRFGPTQAEVDVYGLNPTAGVSAVRDPAPITMSNGSRVETVDVDTGNSELIVVPQNSEDRFIAKYDLIGDNGPIVTYKDQQYRIQNVETDSNPHGITLAPIDQNGAVMTGAPTVFVPLPNIPEISTFMNGQVYRPVGATWTVVQFQPQVEARRVALTPGMRFETFLNDPVRGAQASGGAVEVEFTAAGMLRVVASANPTINVNDVFNLDAIVPTLTTNNSQHTTGEHLVSGGIVPRGSPVTVRTSATLTTLNSTQWPEGTLGVNSGATGTYVTTRTAYQDVADFINSYTSTTAPQELIIQNVVYEFISKTDNFVTVRPVLKALENFRNRYPDTPIILFSANERIAYKLSFKYGSNGELLTEFERLNIDRRSLIPTDTPQTTHAKSISIVGGNSAPSSTLLMTSGLEPRDRSKSDFHFRLNADDSQLFGDYVTIATLPDMAPDETRRQNLLGRLQARFPNLAITEEMVASQAGLSEIRSQLAAELAERGIVVQDPTAGISNLYAGYRQLIESDAPGDDVIIVQLREMRMPSFTQMLIDEARNSNKFVLIQSSVFDEASYALLTQASQQLPNLRFETIGGSGDPSDYAHYNAVITQSGMIVGTGYAWRSMMDARSEQPSSELGIRLEGDTPEYWRAVQAIANYQSAAGFTNFTEAYNLLID